MNPFSVSSIGKAVFVSITRKKGEKGVSGGAVSDFDITRGYWRFRGNGLNKAQQCEVLVAVEKSVVVGAWKIITGSWQLGYMGAIPTRIPQPDDVNRYWCIPVASFSGLKMGLRIDGPLGPGPMCGRSYLFNF